MCILYTWERERPGLHFDDLWFYCFYLYFFCLELYTNGTLSRGLPCGTKPNCLFVFVYLFCLAFPHFLFMIVVVSNQQMNLVYPYRMAVMCRRRGVISKCYPTKNRLVILRYIILYGTVATAQKWKKIKTQLNPPHPLPLLLPYEMIWRVCVYLTTNQQVSTFFLVCFVPVRM